MFLNFHYHVILRANYEITVYAQKNFPPNQHASSFTNIQVTHRDILAGVTVPRWAGFLANPYPHIISVPKAWWLWVIFNH